jgi:CSLREA domain-containing protein
VALSTYLIVLAAPAVALADTFTVNTPADHLVGACDAADCTLREAVTVAANGDVINVPANTYMLSANFGGELLVDANITIVGTGARQTIIDANLGSRVMRVAPPVGTPAPVPVTANVSGVTLTRGIGVGGNNPNGGALHVQFNATLTLTDSAVMNSRSQTGNGGGIYNDGTLNLNRVTVSGNEAVGAGAPANGGGMYLNSNNDPARFVTIVNSTISGNTTNGSGGGIYSVAGVLGLQSTTIAGNTAASGSALFKPGSGTSIQDSILAATTGTACAGAGIAGIVGSNNMATDATCGATATTADPQLGALANNGGSTDTRALAATSPAIGAASPAPARCTGTDQRGVARPQGGTCDIGAYEFSVTQQPPQEGGGQELPPPEGGKTVNVLLKSGTVKVKLPGRKRFRTLSEDEQLPVGTTVDTTKGRVTLVAAGGQSADFYGGIFKIGQKKGSKPRTTLTLTEKLSCPKAGNAIAAAKKKKRRLWGNGSGKFRTKGKHSAATVVGTKWLVEDRCKSTLTRVVRGRVSVRDFVKKKTKIVRAGKRYIARAG